MELKAVIIDDDQSAINTITDIVTSYIPQLKIVDSAKNILKGIEVISLNHPDLVFLDVNMTDGTGFELLNRIGNIKFKIIFITAHNEYALQAIRCSALDYLLKPVDSGDLIRAVNKVKEFIEKESYTLKLETFFKNMITSGKGSKKLILHSLDSVDVVEIAYIIRCQSQNNYTEFHLTGGRTILISKTLKEYEKLLTCEGFYRLHVSHLINLRHVEKIDKKNGNLMIMKDKSKVPFSGRNKEELLRLLESL